MKGNDHLLQFFCTGILSDGFKSNNNESPDESPIEMYERKITSGELKRDSHQIMIIEELQKLHVKLKTYEAEPVKEPGFLSKVNIVTQR